MRTTIALSTIAAGGLLLGSTLGAAAQGIEPATYVTGSLIFPDGCEDALEYSECAGFGFEASDPRLTAEGVMRISIAELDGADPAEFGAAVSKSVRLENADGAWSGSGTNAVIFGNDGKLFDQDMVILAGEGAYDGLTAVVFADGEESEEFEALIFGGDMPPLPPVPTE